MTIIRVLIAQDQNGGEGVCSFGPGMSQMPAFYGGDKPEIIKALYDLGKRLKVMDPSKRVFVRTYVPSDEEEV